MLYSTRPQCRSEAQPDTQTARWPGVSEGALCSTALDKSAGLKLDEPRASTLRRPSPVCAALVAPGRIIDLVEKWNREDGGAHQVRHYWSLVRQRLIGWAASFLFLLDHASAYKEYSLHTGACSNASYGTGCIQDGTA